jgi:hypothetical protein
MKIALGILAVYLVCGVGMAVMLKQTPYQGNPLWAMVLLWPLYLWSGI